MSIAVTPVSAVRSNLSPAARTTLFVVLGAIVGSVIGALTGEKTTFLYKEQLHLSASDVGTLALILGLPAYVQPFLGAWSDTVPLLGYRRRSYYILGHLAGALGFLGLAMLHQYTYAAVVCLLLVSGMFGIFSGVAANAVLVSVGNATGTFGRFKSLQQFVPMVLSVLCTARLAGYVTQYWSYQSAFGTAALLSLLFLPLSLLLVDTRVAAGPPSADKEAGPADRATLAAESAEKQARQAALRQAIKSPGLWAIVGFVFYLIITPGVYTAQIYYETDVLHLSKLFIGELGAFSSAGIGLGLLLFMVGSRRLPVISLVIGAWLMDCCTYPALLLLHDAPSAKIVVFSTGAVGTLYGLCLYTLAARACPRGIEGAIYGLIMAAIAFAGSLSEKFGGWLYDFFGPEHHHTIAHGWQTALWVGLVFTIAGGVFIPFLPAWAKSRRPLSASDPEVEAEAFAAAQEQVAGEADGDREQAFVED